MQIDIKVVDLNVGRVLPLSELMIIHDDDMMNSMLMKFNHMMMISRVDRITTYDDDVDRIHKYILIN